METRGNLIAVTPAGESNKGDTSGACLMIFSFRLFQLDYLAVIYAESVSLSLSSGFLLLSEAIPLSLCLPAAPWLSVGLFAFWLSGCRFFFFFSRCRKPVIRN